MATDHWASTDEIDAVESSARDFDGVAALHDLEAEAGDEDEAEDLFVIDRRAAAELGVDLDPVEGEEPVLG